MALRFRVLLWLGAAAVGWAAERVPLADGYAEIEFLRPSTFRFVRVWGEGQSPAPRELASEHLRLSLDAAGRVTVRAASTGKLLMEEAQPARREGGAIVLERLAPTGEEFFGLGPRTEERLGARGLQIATAQPFLISTAGYGLDHKSEGRYEFDLARGIEGRAVTRIAGATRLEYLFHYGPAPKEIYEERLGVSQAIDYDPADVEVRSARRVPEYAQAMPPPLRGCAAVRAAVHASLSGTVAPAVNLDTAGLSDAVAAVLPLVYRERPGAAMPVWRERLRLFLVTYLQEVRDRGFPMMHALPLQYPTEAGARDRSDEYLLGDELLIAPLCDGGSQRTVYLPRGTWTDLRTGETHAGRQTITVTGDATRPILLARNGAIIPIQMEGKLELHYQPRLGAEFFLWETAYDDISQVHASPAGDFLRLEIESRTDRVYEWVIHLGAGKEQRHRMEAKAGGDEILNLPLPWREGR